MDANLLDLAGYLRAVRAANVKARLLVAAGGFGGPAGHGRVGVLELRDEGASVLVDAWLPSSDVAGLVDALRSEGFQARAGGWDTMYATAYRFAWTSDARGPFEIWSDQGLECTLVEGSVRARTSRTPAATIVTVEPYVSGDWIERGVRLRTADGALVVLARDEDQGPAIDPTYDGLNLMADVWWTHALARALVERLDGVPLADCT
ncbi:MAG: hypothetical protein IT374_03585 [Polyangiaceae bacterium]|nr:hypothetical protein [Polyangiaceae bacterium]